MKDRLRWLVLALVVAAAPGRCAAGAEPVDAFLAALRQHQMFDEADEYLGLLAANPTLGINIQERAPYERCVTALESATARTDPEGRAGQLKRAGELFAKFLAENPTSPLAGSAKTQLANILLERGRAMVQAAGPPGKGDSPDEARKLFAQAKTQFDVAEKELDAQLQKLPKLIPPTETGLQDQKHRLSSDLVQTRLLRAGIEYELAHSFEPRSTDAKKHLTAAAQGYAALGQTYRTRAAGLLARLWEGRCYQEMGDIPRAQGCYQELMDLPSTPETLSIKTKSTRQALECWTSSGQKKYQEAIERGERWEQEAGEGQTDSDALAIRYLTALACQAQSKTLPAKDPNRKKMLGSARHYVAPVAMHPGEYQRPAKVLLVALAAKEPKEKGSAGAATFADAFEQANQGLEQMQEAADNLKTAQEKKDANAIRKLELQKKQITSQLLDTLRRALTLANDKTPLEDLNSVRWYICYLLWDTGQYYDAAVLGEFLARHYPDSTPGQRGAKVALAAYVQLFNDAKAENKDFEAAHIQAIGDYIFKRWPEQEEAEDAALTLLNFAASQRQYEKAIGYLKRVPSNSPRRMQAELRAGQAIWSAYLHVIQTPADKRPPQAELDTLKEQALDTLSQGIARVQPTTTVDAALAAAVFALVQIYIESGQYDKAIEWLDNAQVGPLALVQSNNPAAAREGFAIETYKMALRAYISVSPPQLKKAEAVMDSLDKLVQGSGDSHAAENLTAIYVSLGRELERQLQELRKTGQKREFDAVSKAFEVFLDRVTKRDTGNSFAALSWAAETYYTLASSIDAGGPASAKGKAYYQKAAEGYQHVMDVAEKDPKLKEQPPNLLGIRMRLADCYRRAGKFDEATKTMLELLREKPMVLNAQVQAAEIYQDRGAVDAQGYALAVSGSNPGKNGRNIIWGWQTISQIAMKDLTKYEKTFHEARLKMAEARLMYAQTVKDPPKRTKILDAAKHDLWSTYKQVPDLGGPVTSAEYDKLLKEIQKNLGNQETGLTEFKQRDAAAAAADAK